MDILKEFKGSRDLNETLDNFSEKLPRRSMSVAKPSTSKDVQDPPKDPKTPFLVLDIAPILMTGPPDIHASFSGIKQTQNQTLMIPLRKTHSTSL